MQVPLSANAGNMLCKPSCRLGNTEITDGDAFLCKLTAICPLLAHHKNGRVTARGVHQPATDEISRNAQANTACMKWFQSSFKASSPSTCPWISCKRTVAGEPNFCPCSHASHAPHAEKPDVTHTSVRPMYPMPDWTHATHAPQAPACKNW